MSVHQKAFNLLTSTLNHRITTDPSEYINYILYGSVKVNTLTNVVNVETQRTYVVNNYAVIHRNVDDQTTPAIINSEFSTHEISN